MADSRSGVDAGGAQRRAHSALPPARAAIHRPPALVRRRVGEGYGEAEVPPVHVQPQPSLLLGVGFTFFEAKNIKAFQVL